MDRDYLAEAFRIADSWNAGDQPPHPPSLGGHATMLLPERAHIVALVEEIRRKDRLMEETKRSIGAVLYEIEDMETAISSAKAKLDAVVLETSKPEPVYEDR